MRVPGVPRPKHMQRVHDFQKGLCTITIYIYLSLSLICECVHLRACVMDLLEHFLGTETSLSMNLSLVSVNANPSTVCNA